MDAMICKSVLEIRYRIGTFSAESEYLLMSRIRNIRAALYQGKAYTDWLFFYFLKLKAG